MVIIHNLKPFKNSYLRQKAELSNPHDLMSAITSSVYRNFTDNEAIMFQYGTSMERCQELLYATKPFKKLYHLNRMELSLLHGFIPHYSPIT